MAYGFGFGRARSRYNKELTPAGRVFMALIGLAFTILPFMEFDKYANLAKDGKEAEAKVISYNPTYTHSKNGTTTHHWHLLSIDGRQQRVELKRQVQAGAKIFIVYDQVNPGTAAEGRKGMSGADLMGSDYGFMWLMIGLGAFLVLMAFVAPSKPGTGIGLQSTSAGNPVPESFSGLAGQAAVKKQGNVPFSGGTNEANAFTPAIETAIPFAPGGPKEAEKAPAAGHAFSKFGDEVMDEGYRLFKDNAELAPAALAEKFGHLTIGQAKEVIAKADALDYTADDEANNVQGGIYPADKAVLNLIKTNPGFSEQLYKNIITDKIKLS